MADQPDTPIIDRTVAGPEARRLATKIARHMILKGYKIIHKGYLCSVLSIQDGQEIVPFVFGNFGGSTGISLDEFMRDSIAMTREVMDDPEPFIRDYVKRSIADATRRSQEAALRKQLNDLTGTK